jgi:predicted P-loop ATPase/GTPase
LIEKEKCSPQNAVTVEMNVKYHSSQKTIDLFIAENASKITNPHQDLAEDLVEDLVATVETEVLDLVEEMIDHEKCLTQNAVTVEMIVKSHLDQKTTDLFIAESVSKITNKVKKIVLSNFQNSFILYPKI